MAASEVPEPTLCDEPFCMTEVAPTTTTTMTATACEYHTRERRYVRVHNGPGFFALPLEIRRMIYKELLAREENGGDVAWYLEGMGRPAHGLAVRLYKSTSSPKSTSILRTCAQVCREAVPVLYTQNVFVANHPATLLALLQQAGPANVRRIRSLLLFVADRSTPPAWTHLFDVLARDARGLRYLRVVWSAGTGSSRALEAAPGLGKSVDVARAMAQIHGLETLVMEGYCAQNWPAYFERTMRVPVDVLPLENYYERAPSRMARETVEKQKKAAPGILARYQEGTEDLWP